MKNIRSRPVEVWNAVLLLFLLFGCKIDAAENSVPDIPVGVHEVTILGVVAPSRVQELTQKMQMAQADNPGWLQKYVEKEARPGEPLPWHENSGLSKAEYEEYLSIAEAFSLLPVGSSTLEITRKGQSISFVPGEGLEPLGSVALDLNPLSVSSSYGDCTSFTNVEPSPATKPEPWRGVNCRSTAGESPENARSVVFSVGLLQEKGSLFLRFEGKEVRDGTLSRRADVFLTIP